MANWLIFPPDGGTPHQVVTLPGEHPDARDNPEGWRAVKVKRHSHDPRERYDEAAKRWVVCPHRTAEHDERERRAAAAWFAGMPAGVLDLLTEAMTARRDRGASDEGTEQ